jgi:hypothetical protein
VRVLRALWRWHYGSIARAEAFVDHPRPRVPRWVKVVWTLSPVVAASGSTIAGAYGAALVGFFGVFGMWTLYWLSLARVEYFIDATHLRMKGWLDHRSIPLDELTSVEFWESRPRNVSLRGQYVSRDTRYLLVRVASRGPGWVRGLLPPNDVLLTPTDPDGFLAELERRSGRRLQAAPEPPS